MSNYECKCTHPTYNAFTGRCMACGCFHKKDLEMQFDYESRKWEEQQSKPVCVACLNESRAHQIPGEHEHICGKQAPNTQLPAEVDAAKWNPNDKERDATTYASIVIAFLGGAINKLSTGCNYEAIEFDVRSSIYHFDKLCQLILPTEYANKLYAADKANSALEEKNRGLSEENKECKEECERLAKVAEHWQQEYYKLNPPRQPMKIDNNPIA